jgi:hypothetical protein
MSKRLNLVEVDKGRSIAPSSTIEFSGNTERERIKSTGDPTAGCQAPYFSLTITDITL